MAKGTSSVDEMIRATDENYAVGFRGGQVDGVSGNFVFDMSEAYHQNGKIGAPIKGHSHRQRP